MSSRDRLIQVTARLIREKGMAATGINEIITTAGLPKGSMYHYFPGGKEELVKAALHSYKDWLGQSFKARMKGSTTAEQGLCGIVDFFIHDLTTSHYVAGCPVATVALESAGTAPGVTEGVREVMDHWIASLCAYLQYKGLAGNLTTATDFITHLEGALVMARIYQSTEPLERLKLKITELLQNDHTTP
ncbi:MAG: TetR/AcrR family transcriptional regulator [Saprospiraceae bacterium]|nr:TetR/AcrR family transcriptional regulator [Saprospiraceae bacterium]